MATAIKLKKSSVSSNAPGTGDIDYGELAINYADGKLFYKNSSNVIKNFSDSDAVQTQIDNAIVAAGSYNDASVDAHLNQSTAAAGQYLNWDGSDYSWDSIAAGVTSIDDLSDAIADSATGTSLSLGLGSGALANDDGTANNNVAVGIDALNTNVSGYFNVAVGYQTLYSNDGLANTAAGYMGLYSNTTGSFNTSMGFCAMSGNITGGNNTAVGASALKCGVRTTAHTAIGSNSMCATTGGNCSVAIGMTALRFGTTHQQNVAVGASTMYNTTCGYYNTALGSSALCNQTTGHNNVAIGVLAGLNITTGCNNVIIGNCANASSATATDEITIGSTTHTSFRLPGLQATATHGQVLAFDSAGGDIAFTTVAAGGASSIDELSDAIYDTTDNNLGLGESVLGNITAGAGTANDNTGLGDLALQALTTGNYNTAVGAQALQCQTGGCHSATALGYQAGRCATKNGLIAIGTLAAACCAGAYGGVAIGWRAMRQGQGNGAIAIGMDAGVQMTGQGNMAIGRDAMGGASVTGIYNHIIGYGAGKCMTTGRYNTSFGQTSL